MRKLLAVAALVGVCMLVPSMQAASLVANANITSGSFSSGNDVLTLSFGALGTITFTGYSCGSVTLCTSVATTQESKTALTDSNGALGIASNTPGDQIPRNDFVTIDFSNFHAPITSVTLNMADVVAGWDVYSTSKANELDSSGNTGSPLAQGNNQQDFTLQQDPIINSISNKNSSTGSSTFAPTSLITVSALQDCEVEIQSISVYYTPEPATCLLMGGTLVGIGLAGKKLRRRS